jgi:hypothetical protein
MLSTPELKQRAAVAAPYLFLAGSLALAQTRRQWQQPDASLPVIARQLAQQTLPAVAVSTLAGGCDGINSYVTKDLNATNKHVLNCGRWGTISTARNRRTFPITARWSYPQHNLAPVRIIRADTKPLALSTLGLLALVHIPGECLVADN